MKKSYIVLKEYLDIETYEDISKLQKMCIEHDETSLKLELDYKLMWAKEADKNELECINEFCYYLNDQLVGYIGIGSFGGSTPEVNGMVHPEFRRRGIFTKLFDLVKEEWTKRDSKEMLLLSDEASVSGKAFIDTLEADYEHTEYEMFFNDGHELKYNDFVVSLRKATNDDAKEISYQNSVYFNDAFNLENDEDEVPEYQDKQIMPEDEEKRGMTTFLAVVDNKIIGKTNLQVNDTLGGIYGLGVLPEARKKGYGRQILTLSVKKLKEMSCKNVMLQVSAQNKHALELYKSCGFQETSTMEYYQMAK